MLRAYLARKFACCRCAYRYRSLRSDAMVGESKGKIQNAITHKNTNDLDDVTGRVRYVDRLHVATDHRTMRDEKSKVEKAEGRGGAAVIGCPWG